MPESQSSLFSPVEIGSLELSNRLVRSATAESLATEPEGKATPPWRSSTGSSPAAGWA